MITAIAIALTLAGQGKTECQTATLEHVGVNTNIVARNGADNPRLAMVGHYLNIGDDWEGELQSVDVADPELTSVTVCTDGAIVLHWAGPQSEAEPEVNASQDSPAPIYLVPRVQDATAGSAV